MKFGDLDLKFKQRNQSYHKFNPSLTPPNMLNALDLLYIVLAIGIALVSIFGSILLLYAIFILRDVNKASGAVKESAERVNNLIVRPLQMTRDLVKMARPVIEVAERKFHERNEEKTREKTEKSKKKSKWK